MDRLRELELFLGRATEGGDASAAAAWDDGAGADGDAQDVDVGLLEATERNVTQREQQIRARLEDLAQLLDSQCGRPPPASAHAMPTLPLVQTLVALHARAGADAKVPIYEHSPHYVTFVRIVLRFCREFEPLREDAEALELVVGGLLHRLLFQYAGASPLVTKETLLTCSALYNICAKHGIALPSYAILHVPLPRQFPKDPRTPGIPNGQHLGIFAACVRYLQSCIQSRREKGIVRVPALVPRDLEAMYMETIGTSSDLWMMALKAIRELWKSLASNGSGQLTALLNILYPIVAQDPKKYTEDVFHLYKELITVEIASLPRNMQGQAKLNAMKAVKNGITAILRNQDKVPVSMDMAVELLDILQSKLGARIDVLQLQQLLLSRGMDVKAARAAAKRKEEEEKEKARAAQKQPVAEVTVEQQAAAIISALHYYAHPNKPETPIPAFDEKQIPLPLVTEIVLRGLHMFGASGSVGAVDGGVSAWQQAVSHVKSSTATILNRMIKGDEEEKMAATEASKQADHAEKEKEKKLQPFVLKPDAGQLCKSNEKLDEEQKKMVNDLVLDLVKGMVRRVATRSGVVASVQKADQTADGDVEDETTDAALQQQGVDEEGLDESAEGDALTRLEGGSIHWLFSLSTNVDGDMDQTPLAGNKRKRDRELPESREVALKSIRSAFKGSRGFWTLFVARVVNHLARLDSSLEYMSFQYPVKARVLIPFILQDFPGRWDFAVRWLWEEMYRCQSVGGDRFVEYDFWLTTIMDQLFQSAEHAAQNVQLQRTTYIPWFVNQNESALFRKFLLALPRLPPTLWDSNAKVSVPHEDVTSVPASGQLAVLLETPLNKPLPTPLQKLRLQLGIEILYDFITARPSTRKLAIPRFQDFCLSEHRVRRLETIRVAKRFWTPASTVKPDENMQSPVELNGLQKRMVNQLEAFAVESFQNLSAPPKGGEVVVVAAEEDAMDVDTTENQKPPTSAEAREWTEETAACHLDLFMVMASRNPSLLHHLFELFPALEPTGVVRRMVLAMLGRSIAHVGMPRPSNPDGMKLLAVMDRVYPAGSEILLLRILQVMSSIARGKPAVTSTDEKSMAAENVPPRISTELSNLALKRVLEYPQQFHHPLFWAYLIPAEGLSAEHITRGIVHLLAALDDEASGIWSTLVEDGITEAGQKDRSQVVFVTTLARLFWYQRVATQETISPNEVLYLLHTVDIAPPLANLPSVTPRQMITAIGLCLNHAYLAPYFTSSTFAKTLDRLLDRYIGNLPKILMSTMRHTIRKYRELAGFTVDMLTRIANTRIFKGRGRMEGDGKVIWEYWIRCVELTAPKSFPLLVQLSRTQISDILALVGPVFKESLYVWLKTRSRTEKVIHALNELDKARAAASAAMAASLQPSSMSAEGSAVAPPPPAAFA